MNKEEVKNLAALTYAESVKKVSKPIMDAWRNGFHHCDKTLGLKYQMQEYESECNDYIDHWEERAGYSDARGKHFTDMRDKAKSASDVIEAIKNLRNIITEYEQL